MTVQSNVFVILIISLYYGLLLSDCCGTDCHHYYTCLVWQYLDQVHMAKEDHAGIIYTFV